MSYANQGLKLIRMTHICFLPLKKPPAKPFEEGFPADRQEGAFGFRGGFGDRFWEPFSLAQVLYRAITQTEAGAVFLGLGLSADDY
ncbi:MAG: hypothetical protein IT262_23060 [Saprospiraceae bacterium]|nr:hypothetical protein [Saprospiraceae bacterium]